MSIDGRFFENSKPEADHCHIGLNVQESIWIKLNFYFKKTFIKQHLYPLKISEFGYIAAVLILVIEEVGKRFALGALN